LTAAACAPMRNESNMSAVCCRDDKAVWRSDCTLTSSGSVLRTKGKLRERRDAALRRTEEGGGPIAPELDTLGLEGSGRPDMSNEPPAPTPAALPEPGVL